MKHYILIDSNNLEKILDELSFIKTRLNTLNSINLSEHSTKSILTNSDLQKLLKVSKVTLQNWRDKGLIAFSQIQGKIYYQYNDVLQFLENHKKTTFS